MRECIFCNIIGKKVPGYFVLEEKNYIAILDLFGSAPGHTMVIPRKHGYSILDYSEKELGELMVGVQKVAKKIEKALKTDALTIGINHFEEKGVPHLHIHLIPRYKDDGGKVIQNLTKAEINEDMEKIAEKIRNS